MQQLAVPYNVRQHDQRNPTKIADQMRTAVGTQFRHELDNSNPKFATNSLGAKSLAK